jgi:uncharacterized protein
MKIPSFSCKEGCHACCGIVPFNEAEKQKASAARPLEQWEPFVDGRWVTVSALMTMKCPFLSAGGCSIYDDRPMVCRLFGSVDHPRMKCPMGCGPKRMLTDEQSRKMLGQI